MSDKMTPLSTKQLINWIISEYNNNGSVFGINKSIFFKPDSAPAASIFGTSLDTLIGPAAGPHTQMTQNIIASYLTGGRFIELKTVQILDELEISKPCIDAADECYNIEWSQELKLEQSYKEYIKAWVLLHFIKNLFNLSNAKDSGFIFNMSVGYDLKGIKSEAVDKFISEVKNASTNSCLNDTINSLQEEILTDKIKRIIHSFNPDNDRNDFIGDIPSNVSNSITLSTMHGCPPDEIEAIAKYLMTEKNLHTYVKLNPTLLGSEFVNGTLNELGYKYLTVNDLAFEKDLKMKDAVPMIKRLQRIAENQNVEFGVKLSNTLQVDNEKGNLKADEMYMSGRSLFPFTINLASKLVEELSGNINISYSGGATAENVTDIIKCGIKPITVATDLLKPGGYGRLKQMAEKLQETEVPTKINSSKLSSLSKDSLINENYKKDKREVISIKVPSKLPLFDCYIAPCQAACPIHQDVPEYINLVKSGKYAEALNIITSKNPLPHITGYICDHQCMNHCTRWDYDEPVLIRDLKKEAAIKGFEKFIESYKFPAQPEHDSGKVAVIGAGPAGLATSFFLSRAGLDVTVFEKEMNAGGIVKNVIPHFRLPAEVIEKDIKFVEDHGVRFVLGSEYNFELIRLKEEGYKYVVIAIGAEVSNKIKLNKFNKNVIDAIEFLWEFHHEGNTQIGKNVAVIGGGNSAMDGARAAFRCVGVENVYLIYRRTIEFMPADMEEFYAAIDDGVQYKELLQPIEFENGILRCQKMKLSQYDSDGRRKVKPVDDVFIDFEVDTVISAIGEHADFDLLNKNKITVEDGKTFRRLSNLETNIENVFVCGDAGNGPATVIDAIADARKVANEISSRENIGSGEAENWQKPETNNVDEIKSYIAHENSSDMKIEAERCLLCSIKCNKCVDVCPNRANIAVKTDGNIFKDNYQIVHIDKLCNECGNCETFCPHQGKPYTDKFTFFSNQNEVNANPGFYLNAEGEVNLVNIEVVLTDQINNTRQHYKDVANKFLKEYEFLLK